MSKPEEPTAGPFEQRSFNPRSSDAMFATILEHLRHQDGVLEEIRTGVAKTNGRVTALERWRDVVTAKVAVISAGVSMGVGVVVWLAEMWLK